MWQMLSYLPPAPSLIFYIPETLINLLICPHLLGITSVYPDISQSFYLFVHMSETAFLYLSNCPSVFERFWMSVCKSTVILLVCLSILVCLSVCLSPLCLSFRLSVICLSACLSLNPYSAFLSM
jgi:hypothetical protein